MLEHANEKGLIGLSIPPIHRDLHVVDVGERHIQFPVEERVEAQPSFNTDLKQLKSYQPNRPNLSIKSHS